MRSILFTLFSGLQLTAAWVPAPRDIVPAGVTIHRCTQEGTIALTFDDGPFAYTESLLNQLAVAGVKATFFVNGNNWANIQHHRSTILRMVNEGHQVASHTYSHPKMVNLDETGIRTEMTRLEDELINILGKYPVYMRPPFLSSNDLTLRVLGELGYKVIHADIDTFDWEHKTPEAVGTALSHFQAGFQSGGSITLMHDVHQNTVENLVPLIIDAVLRSSKRAVTVGECLGEPEVNWYRTSRVVSRSFRAADHSFGHSRYSSHKH